MGSVKPPFLPQIHNESPGNGISDVPDFKIFLALHAFGAHKFEPSFTNPGSAPVQDGKPEQLYT